jgi:hypothetical protein
MKKSKNLILLLSAAVILFGLYMLCRPLLRDEPLMSPEFDFSNWPIITEFPPQEDTQQNQNNEDYFSYTPLGPPLIVFTPNFSVEACLNPQAGKNCLVEVRGVSFEEADTVCAYNYNKATGEMFVLECKDADLHLNGDVVALYKLRFKEPGKHRLIFILSIGDFPLAMQSTLITVK